MAGATNENEVRALRHRLGVHPVFKRIDSCAAEFEAITPYMYSTYEAPLFGEPENEAAQRPQEDRDPGWWSRTASARASSSTIAAAMPASRWKKPAMRPSWSTATPKRSTDYDTSDRLYFEPLTAEDVLEILASSSPRANWSA
jgi:carbamoyl-phosphate synthase large subunit